jgi:nucleotide-binding universal stress UspA family protein
MRVLAWVEPATWPAVVAASRARPATDTITVAATEALDGPAPAELVHALIGRAHPDPDPGLSALGAQEARALLDQAAEALGRPCTTVLLAGPPERAVITAAADADLLILARDGDHSRLGPHSLGRHTRFVIDHAPCTVELIWPAAAPGLDTVPPPPPPPRRGTRGGQL